MYSHEHRYDKDGIPRPVLPDRELPRALPVLGSAARCWCSKPLGHDWPGRADRAPHPRGSAAGPDARELVPA